jgi:hypothetical protein
MLRDDPRRPGSLCRAALWRDGPGSDGRLSRQLHEYHFLYITALEHIESKSIQSVGLIKLQFHPGTDMAGAMAETVNYVNRARAFMPTGTALRHAIRRRQRAGRRSGLLG